MIWEWWILATLTSGSFLTQSPDRSSQRRGWMSKQWDGLKTCSKSTWKPEPTGVPQGSILSAILLSSFINNLNDGAECKFSKSAEVTKMGGVADTPRMLELPSIGHLMSWRNGLMQIPWSVTMGGAKCCAWGGTTPAQTHAGDCPAGKQFGKKGSGGSEGHQVEHKPAGRERGSFPSVQLWLGHTCGLFWTPQLNTRETWRYRREFNKGPQRWWMDWSISPMRESWESWGYSAGTKEGSGGIWARI